MTPIPPDCPDTSTENSSELTKEDYSNNAPEIPKLESGKRVMMVISFFFLG